MTCLDVRERLTEYALGLLAKVDASEVERHLEWCAGCRKESAELEEGAARVALALPVANPHASLETQVVDRVRSAAGRVPAGVRHRRGRLLAATLAAALLAMGATGWALAERKHVQTLSQTLSAKQAQVTNLAKVLKGLQGRGKTFLAKLSPSPGGRGGGSAVISSAPNVNDFLFIDVLLPSAHGPFVVQLVDDKTAIKIGHLKKAVEGDWVLYKQTNQDLSGVVSITVLDSESRTVLAGAVQPYAK